MTTRIYALGDSITYGFPYGPHRSWVKMVAQTTGYTIINGGINGDTTAFMLHRLRDALAQNPSHLILLGGTNDAYWGQHLSEVSQNISEIFSRCRKEGVKPILGLPIPVDEPQVEALLADYRAFMQDLAKRDHIPIIPFQQAFLDEYRRFKVELTTDGCHPNIDGYEVMAEFAQKLIPHVLER